MTELGRRGLLAAVGAGAAALAGCSGGGSGNDGGTAAGSGDGLRLEHVDLINRESVSHTVHLQVERDGEVVYWGVHDLAAPGGEGDSGALVERSWDREPGSITVEARVDDGPVRSRTYTAADGACIGVFAPIDDGIAFYDGDVDCGADATATSA